MGIQFPLGLDNFGSSVGDDMVGGLIPLRRAVEALEAKVGVDRSAATASHDYMLRRGITFSPTAGGEDYGFLRTPEGTSSTAPIKPWTLFFGDHGIVQTGRNDQIMDIGYNLGASSGLYDTNDLGFGFQFESYFLNGGKRWVELFAVLRCPNGNEYRAWQINWILTTPSNPNSFESVSVTYASDTTYFNKVDGTQLAKIWDRIDLYKNTAIVTNNQFYYGVKVDGTFIRMLGVDASDLIQLGDSNGLSLVLNGFLLRTQSNSNFAAAGTTQANATPLTKEFCVVSNDSTAKGVILTAPVGGMHVVRNLVGGSTVKVWPPVGDEINGGGTDLNVTQVTNNTTIYFHVQAGEWFTK